MAPGSLRRLLLVTALVLVILIPWTSGSHYSQEEEGDGSEHSWEDHHHHHSEGEQEEEESSEGWYGDSHEDWAYDSGEDWFANWWDHYDPDNHHTTQEQEGDQEQEQKEQEQEQEGAELRLARLQGPLGSVCTRHVWETRCITDKLPFPCWMKSKIPCSRCRSGCRRHGRDCYIEHLATCYAKVKHCVQERVPEEICCDGYEQRGNTCSRSLQCQGNNGGCDQTCISTSSSHRCECFNGYTLSDNRECIDEDECAINNGGCSHGCKNIAGGFYCTCPNGYILGRPTVCEELDECAMNNGGCAHQCHNTVGAFYCECDAGFTPVHGFKCEAESSLALAQGARIPAIAGGATGGLILIIILVILCVCFIRRKPTSSSSRTSHAAGSQQERPKALDELAAYREFPGGAAGPGVGIDNHVYEKIIKGRPPGPTPPPYRQEPPPNYIEATAPQLNYENPAGDVYETVDGDTNEYIYPADVTSSPPPTRPKPRDQEKTKIPALSDQQLSKVMRNLKAVAK